MSGPVDKDHHSICKFESGKDRYYLMTVNLLRQLTKDLGTRDRSRVNLGHSSNQQGPELLRPPPPLQSAAFNLCEQANVILEKGTKSAESTAPLPLPYVQAETVDCQAPLKCEVDAGLHGVEQAPTGPVLTPTFGAAFELDRGVVDGKMEICEKNGNEANCHIRGLERKLTSSS